MKVSYNWLEQYIDLDLTSSDLENKLTFGGIEVEEVLYIGEDLKQIKIARIIEKNKHPQADKLSICLIDDGVGLKQVVCGAPNCEVNQKIAFAPVGSKLGDFKIQKVKIRGEVSFGMICSEKELGISENHDGIMVLPDNAPIGQNICSYLELDDTVFDVEITPNRPDLLGIFGIARDLSALLNLPLKPPEIVLKNVEEKIKNTLALDNKEPELCPRYTARVIKGVQIKESPQWLKKRLISVGLRPINNIVDITNFVMMELGHPLHSFDYNKLEGKKIVVRRAKKGEEFPALDDEVYKLTDSDVVIADTKKPIALAGIIGGQNSHITNETKDIVIEAANFLYSSIRRTASRLNISTDSSYRFERNIADETADFASRRAAQLILEIAGGVLLKGKLDSYPKSGEKIEINLRPSKVKKILTIGITGSKIKSYLEALGLKLIRSEQDLLGFEIPPYRKDLTREIDLIEEVIRLHGYNNVETFFKPQNIMDNDSFYSRRKVKDLLVSHGFSEIINWSFGDPEDLDILKINEDDERKNCAKIKNPLGSSFSIMRSMLLPHLLKNTLFNINHGQKDIKIFELAKVFTRKAEKLATEKYEVCGLITGNMNPIYWKENPKLVDFYDIKGIVEELLADFGLKKFDFRKSVEPYYQAGAGTDVFFKKVKVGSIGKIDTKIAQKFELEKSLYTFEIKLDDILSLNKMGVPKFQEIPKFPPVLRDLSFVVSKEYKLSEIINTIININTQIIRKVVLFDEYTGENIKKGHRSLSFSIMFSSNTKTLTDDFINNIIQKVIKDLKSRFKIEMR